MYASYKRILDRACLTFLLVKLCFCALSVIYTTGGVTGSHDILNANIYAFDLEKLTFQIVGRQELPTFFHDLAAVPGVSFTPC